MTRRAESPSTRRRTTPHLVLRFSVFTAIAVAIASAAIFFLVRGFVTTQARDAVEQNTRFVAETVLAHELRPSDFAQPTPKRKQELDQLFRDQVMIDDVERASLYGPDGHLAYSTDPATADDMPGADGFTMSSNRIRTVVHEETPAAGPPRKVLEQVVPIWFGDRPTGVFVTTRDYGPIAASVRKTFIPIALVLEALLLALFASLYPVLKRVSRQMDTHLEEMEHQALHDSLTGLPNRVLFHDRIGVECAHARRVAGRVAVLLLDLDRFKEINDALGHATGDELLRKLATRIQEALRDNDTLARLGGDELGVVMAVREPEDVLDAANRIHRALERPFELGGLKLEVGASIGGVVFPDDAIDPDTLVRFADVAMYAAKRNRTGTELYHPDVEATSRDSLTLAGELREALERGQIVAHFQPQIELVSGRIVAAEALVRWAHPKHGLMPPAAFLPLVEKSDLMSLLTTRVLELAVRQVVEWDSRGIELGTAVNVDVTTLLDPAFPDTVRAIIEREGLSPERLTLEITETTIMADQVLAGQAAERLAAIGVRLSIDDFGSGYSSLGHLTSLPLAELKIDRSFVERMTESSSDMTIIRAILDLGASLDLSVVAEGIESEESLVALGRLGCRIAQGYHFSRPVPPEELTAKLLRTRTLGALPSDAARAA